MSKKRISKRPCWIYRTKNKYGRYEDYSGIFVTVREAQEWHKKHGIKLEIMFNRKLILFYGQTTYYQHLKKTKDGQRRKSDSGQ